jgi:hypothetical protein
MTEEFKKQIETEARQAVTELLAQAKLKKGDVFVVGCSSSEIVGGHIGKDSKATVKVKASLGGSNRAVRDYDRVSTNQYFELYWEALRNQYAKSSDYTSATAAAQASKDLVTKLMGGGPNPYEILLDEIAVKEDGKTYFSY